MLQEIGGVLGRVGRRLQKSVELIVGHGPAVHEKARQAESPGLAGVGIGNNGVGVVGIAGGLEKEVSAPDVEDDRLPP